MNCKPGDLAVIVRTPDPRVAVEGKVIRVDQLLYVDGEPCWTYDGYPLRGIYQLGSWRWHEIPDAWLRPIRDPGDDARDETLEWLPVPSHTKEAA